MAQAPEILSAMLVESRLGDTSDVSRPSRSHSPLPLPQTAHDLANFLTGIRLLLESIAPVLPDEPVVQQYLGSLERTALHASELCEQLQHSLAGIGRAEEEEPDACEVDLGAMVSAMDRLLEVMVRPGAELRIDAEAGLPRILGNPTRLRQIVLDLLTNASDALGEQGGSITIRTGVHECVERLELGPLMASGSRDTAHWVVLEVTDSGCGIDEQRLQSIFEPTYTTKSQGHGLGLSSVLQIVHGYGGAVAVDSRVGQGTRIRCIFPAVETRPQERPPPASPPPRRSATGHASILLIEDNEAARRASKLVLETSSEGRYRVLSASTGREAMDLFRPRRDDISVIVLDAQLPDCDGLALLGEIRELSADVPVLVVSGLPERELRAKCNGHQPDGFLIKPFGAETLVDSVRSVLEK